MNNIGKRIMRKILALGSIVAVVLLVLGSLPSVIGYQTIKNTVEKTSLITKIKNNILFSTLDKTIDGIGIKIIGLLAILYVLYFALWDIVLNYPDLAEKLIRRSVNLDVAIIYLIYIIFIYLPVTYYVYLAWKGWHFGSFISLCLEIFIGIMQGM